MASILRVFGNNLNIVELVDEISIKPYRSWKKGESRLKGGKGKLNENSGIAFCASEYDMESFDDQLDESIDFRNLHQEEILYMVSFSGAEAVVLDCAIELQDRFINSDMLTPDFLKNSRQAGNIC